MAPSVASCLLSLNLTKSLKQARQFTPVTLGKFAANVSFLVNQAALNHRVRKELLHHRSQRIAAIKNGQQSTPAVKVPFDQSTQQLWHTLAFSVLPRSKSKTRFSPSSVMPIATIASTTTTAAYAS